MTLEKLLGVILCQLKALVIYRNTCIIILQLEKYPVRGSWLAQLV